MMPKIIIILFTLINIVSCSPKTSLNGNWELALDIQGHKLPILIQLKDKQGDITGSMINSDEVIPLSGKIVEDKFELEIGTSYAMLKGTITNNALDAIG